MSQYATYESITKGRTDQKSDFPPCFKVTTEDARQNIIDAHNIVCVYLSADWCEPCKAVGPKVDGLAASTYIPGVCTVIKEDIGSKLSGHTYGNQGIPAFMFYRNGDIVGRKGADTPDIASPAGFSVNPSWGTGGAHVGDRGTVGPPPPRKKSSGGYAKMGSINEGTKDGPIIIRGGDIAEVEKTIKTLIRTVSRGPPQPNGYDRGPPDQGGYDRSMLGER